MFRVAAALTLLLALHVAHVAAVAAVDAATAQAAVDAIVVEYEVLAPLLDPEAAIDGNALDIHPNGNVLRRQRVVHGDPDATGPVVVEGTYETWRWTYDVSSTSIVVAVRRRSVVGEGPEEDEARRR